MELEEYPRLVEPHLIDVCVDCLYLLANGRPESVEPSWCPPEHNNYHGGYLDRPGEPACEGTCEESFERFLGAIEQETGGSKVTLGDAGYCEYCYGEEEDCEPWFSMSACGHCGSRLGGHRAHATIWIETDKRGHDWQRGLATGVLTCKACGLLPLETLDMATECDGVRPN